MTQAKSRQRRVKGKAAGVHQAAEAEGGQGKRCMVLVTGSKGGTGKSTFARGLRDVLWHRGVSCAAYDCDGESPQLHRFYQAVEQGVHRIDIFARGGADALIDDLEQDLARVTLVDLPAGSSKALAAFESEVGFIETARELGYRVTLVSVMSRVKDSVNALRLLMDDFEDRVSYLGVKNLFFGQPEKFQLFDHSQVRQRLLVAGGRVIAMPDLFDDTYDLLDEQNLTFRAAGVAASLSRAHRARVLQWLQRFETELVQVGAWLGVDE